MTQYKSQIQNLFLSECRKKHQPCEVVLDTGATLHGKVKSYDQFSITLIFKDKVEVIYKSAIIFITASPRKSRPVSHRPGSGGPFAKRRFSERISDGEKSSLSKSPANDMDDSFDPPPPRKPPAKMRIV